MDVAAAPGAETPKRNEGLRAPPAGLAALIDPLQLPLPEVTGPLVPTRHRRGAVLNKGGRGSPSSAAEANRLDRAGQGQETG